MRWVYILVTSNVPKLVKKCNQLAFLPNAQCNIEKLHCVFLVLGIFSRLLVFLDTNMLVSKT